MMQSFEQTLQQHRLQLIRGVLETVQINLGKKCNQACRHCHVEASPSRTEMMARPTVERILELIDGSSAIRTVDLTGGAPELHPDFEYLVKELRKRDIAVMDRCNLTVLLEKGQERTASFLAENQVHIVASLPCYSEENVNRQRGLGVFEKSIRALQLLNQLGYGRPGSQLKLDLVYNPSGPRLPPSQENLERDYKNRLQNDFGVQFHHLFVMANMPIKRFLWDLESSGRYEEYMELLVTSFNPATLSGLMCRSLVSIGWDGCIYDCDFNQMLELSWNQKMKTIWDLRSFEVLNRAQIRVGSHCHGCTAGAGSSCGGSLA